MIQCVPAGSTRLVFSSSESFAYALFAIVVRKFLPKKDMIDGAESSALEALWKDVYSFVQNREYGFWEKELADHTKMVMHKLLRLAARGKVEPLPTATTSTNGGGTNHIAPSAASIIAWVESSTNTNKAAHIPPWDQAWNDKWEQVWENQWNHELKAAIKRRRCLLLASRISLSVFGGLGMIVPKPIADGMASGRAAGRFPVPIKGATLSPSTENMGGTFAVPDVATERTRAGESANLPTQTAPQVNHTTPEATQTSCLTRSCSAPPINHSVIPYPEGRPTCITTLEIAAQSGWAAGWGRAMEYGPEAVRAAQAQLSRMPGEGDKRRSNILSIADKTKRQRATNQEGTIRTKLAPKIRKELTSGAIKTLHQLHAEAMTTQSQHIKHRDQLKRMAASYARLYLTDAQAQILNQAEVAAESRLAWDRVGSMENSLEQKMRERAESEWRRETQRSETVIMALLVLGQQRTSYMSSRTDAFERVWQIAWEEAWRFAWQETWKFGWSDGAAKGIEFGVAAALEDLATDENNFLLELASYERIKNEIHNEPTAFSSLSKARSMYKELEFLYTALRNSTPMSHENIMKIRMEQTTSKPRTTLVSQLLQDKATLTSSKAISHFEFQEILEKWSNNRFQGHKTAHEVFIRGIAGIWESVQNLRGVQQDETVTAGNQQVISPELLF
ncbi:hypothetical protein FRC07_000131 [Ceratobasidium sp. 392]|nr:hypothetical protein FRC07_000131 [Ceratobasidium sp. 392]